MDEVIVGLLDDSNLCNKLRKDGIKEIEKLIWRYSVIQILDIYRIF